MTDVVKMTKVVQMQPIQGVKNVEGALDWVHRQVWGEYEVRYAEETGDIELKNSRGIWVNSGYKYADGWVYN